MAGRGPIKFRLAHRINDNINGKTNIIIIIINNNNIFSFILQLSRATHYMTETKIHIHI